MSVISEPKWILEERLESQKSRNGLMRWKLIIVSALGSAGLGLFKSEGATNLYLITIVIPIACVYVDLICRTLSLRSMKINVFLSKCPSNISDNIDIRYFQFYQGNRKDVKSFFSLESIALIGSTILLTLVVTIAGILVFKERWISALFLISGLLSLASSFLVQRRYEKEKKEILRWHL